MRDSLVFDSLRNDQIRKEINEPRYQVTHSACLLAGEILENQKTGSSEGCIRRLLDNKLLPLKFLAKGGGLSFSKTNFKEWGIAWAALYILVTEHIFCCGEDQRSGKFYKYRNPKNACRSNV